MKNHLKKILDGIGIDSSKTEFSVGELEQILREVNRKVSSSSKKASLRSDSRSQMLDAVVRSIDGPIYWVDSSLTYLGVNRKVHCSSGDCPSYMVGKKVGIGQYDQFLRPVLQSFFTSEINNYTWDVKIFQKGAPKWFSMTAAKYNGGKAAVVFGHDVSERRLLEQELQKALEAKERDLALTRDSSERQSYSQKMLALGEMADAIAHEINNPLAIINGRISLALNYIEEKDCDFEAIKKSMSSVSGAAERIAKVVSGLRTFSKNLDDEPVECLRIHSIVENAVNLSQEKIDELGVKVTIVDRTSGFQVDCKKGHLIQTVASLLDNSLYAVKDLEDKWIKIELEEKDDQVQLLLTDSGSGISKSLAWKIFKPFFTTREFGQGVGLGLSVARGVVDGHNGSIGLDFSCKNTRFVISLPRAKPTSDRVLNERAS